jgi:hypothetical protein
MALLKDFAVLHNITFVSFGNTIIDKGAIPKIEISDAWGTGLEPAPVTPVNAAPYRLLSGSILATEKARGNDTSSSKSVFVMPSVMSGKDLILEIPIFNTNMNREYGHSPVLELDPTYFSILSFKSGGHIRHTYCR